MLSILFAVGGVAAYTIYSRLFGIISSKSEFPTLSSMFLYGLAALQLFVATFIAFIVFGFNISIPDETKLWAYQFGLSKGKVGIDIGLALLIMIVAYAVSIVQEGQSRKYLNISTFNITHQINAIVIVALSVFWGIKTLDKNDLVGAIVVLFASTLPLLTLWKIDKKMRTNVPIKAVTSGVFSGIGLVTDSNIVRQVIFRPTFAWDKVPSFLFYESITFFLPFLVIFIYYMFFYDGKNIKKEVLAIKANPKAYLAAALCSSLYFVFSVFALALGNTLFISAIFALIPIVSVVFNNNQTQSKLQTTIEYISAILIFCGLSLMAHFIKI